MKSELKINGHVYDVRELRKKLGNGKIVMRCDPTITKARCILTGEEYDADSIHFVIGETNATVFDREGEPSVHPACADALGYRLDEDCWSMLREGIAHATDVPK